MLTLTLTIEDANKRILRDNTNFLSLVFEELHDFTSTDFANAIIAMAFNFVDKYRELIIPSQPSRGKSINVSI